MTDPKNDFVDALFADVKNVQVDPSHALMARVMADAHRAQGAPRPQARSDRGVWAQFQELIGGWPSLGGLVAATAAGLWIGISPPAAVEDLAAAAFGDEISIELASTDLAALAGGF